MTQTALPAHAAVRRRAFFGMFDADGWSWAIAKSLLWFIVIILMLGYIPDRAYYFTVQKTVDLGFLVWSPVNLCPPENETLPCPAPAGATLPWQINPAQVSLPAGRTNGSTSVIGNTYLYAGGSDGAAASAGVYVSHPVGDGNVDAWKSGPALPEARSSAASVTIGSTMYVIGGYGPDGKPTSTVFTLNVANDGTIGDWKTDAVALPAPRAGASAAVVSDGIVLTGGTDGTVATRTVWKTQVSSTGTMGAWKDQMPLLEANMDGVAFHVGDIVFVVGGHNDQGQAVSTVQIARLGGGLNATAKDPNVIDSYWMASAQTNLPGPRANLSGFSANGVLYVQGGSDGVDARTETLWAQPDAAGVIAEWHHLAETDFPQGIQGASTMVVGAHAFTVGGQTKAGLTGSVARTYLAPQLPFFQLGVLGATVPALKLDGEIGQQIGYLNAATVGAVNFVILILIGYAFNHKEKVRSLVGRRRKR
ncbi:MAG: kelch repeat-containing protein [Chloroflexota bacterium]